MFILVLASKASLVNSIVTTVVQVYMLGIVACVGVTSSTRLVHIAADTTGYAYVTGVMIQTVCVVSCFVLFHLSCLKEDSL